MPIALIASLTAEHLALSQSCNYLVWICPSTYECKNKLYRIEIVGYHCFNSLVHVLHRQSNAPLVTVFTFFKGIFDKDTIKIVPCAENYEQWSLEENNEDLLNNVFQKWDRREQLYKNESLKGLIKDDGTQLLTNDMNGVSVCVTERPHEDIFMIRNLFTEEEINHLQKQLLVCVPFEDMSHEYNKNYRSSKRLMFENESLAVQLWQRIDKSLEAVWKEWLVMLRPQGIGTEGFWVPCGLNSFFRLSKYDKGNEFERHQDVRFCKSQECSILSLIIPFNDNFTGGETEFYIINKQEKERKEVVVTIPQIRGRGIIFPHWIEHAGKLVKNGTKIILRADIMFRRIWLLSEDVLRKECEMYKSNPIYYLIRYHFRESVLACQRRIEPDRATSHFLKAALLEKNIHKYQRLSPKESHDIDHRGPQHIEPSKFTSRKGINKIMVTDILKYIMSFASHKELVKWSKTNRYLYHLLYTHNGWMHFHKLRFPIETQLLLSLLQQEILNKMTSKCNFFARASCWKEVDYTNNHPHKIYLCDIGSCTLDRSKCFDMLPTSSEKYNPGFQLIKPYPLILNIQTEIDVGWTNIYHVRPFHLSEINKLKIIREPLSATQFDIESLLWIDVRERKKDNLEMFFQAKDLGKSFKEMKKNIITTTVFPYQLPDNYIMSFIAAPMLLLSGACAQKLISISSANKLAVIHIGNFKSMSWLAVLEGGKLIQQISLFPLESESITVDDIIKKLNSSSSSLFSFVEQQQIAQHILNTISQHNIQINCIILSGRNVPTSQAFNEIQTKGIQLVDSDPFRMHIGASAYHSLKRLFQFEQ